MPVLGLTTLAGFFLGGCSVSIARLGPKAVDPYAEITPRMTRAEVESKLGKPVASEPNPERGEIDIYKHVYPDPYAPSWVGSPPAATAPLNLLSEVYLLPLAIRDYVTRRTYQVRISYDPDDRVVGLEPIFEPPQ